MQKIPYSYHTFLFPFIWKTENDDTIGKFISLLDTDNWKEQIYGTEGVFPKNDQEEYIPDYAVYQYFTEPARNLIFGMGKDNYMRLFHYNHKGKPWGSKENGDEIGYYVITKKEEVFRLVINNIKLNIYESGTAILAFELENWDARDIEKVNLINEYGRRVIFPFLSPGTTVLTADKIEIIVDGEPIASENFLATSRELEEDFTRVRDNKMSILYIMDPIIDLLDGGKKEKDEGNITSNPNKRGFKIQSLIDDRMFVCCAVTDSSFVDYVRGDYRDGSYCYIRDCDKSHQEFNENLKYENHTASNDLYRLLFIEKDCTCNSGVMRKEILKRCIYDRFINWGTIHGVCHHSIICVSSDKHVIDAFLTEYVEIAKIALLQRGTITKLSTEAARISDRIDSGDKKGLEEIEALQKTYVKTQSQILLFEVTAQEQGVDLFNMLKNELYIKKNKEELDEQMNNLRDVANIRNDRLEREADKLLDRKLAILSVLALIIGVFEVAPIILDPYPSWQKMIVAVVAALFGLFLVLYLVRKKNRGNNR